MTKVFSKRYASLEAAQCAAANHRMLLALWAEAMPRLIELDEARTTIVSEHVAGHPISSVEDLVEGARAIGGLQRRWIAAGTSCPRAFSEGRRQLFEARLQALPAGGDPIPPSELEVLWRRCDSIAIGVYKDCNVHNFCIATPTKLLDFDTVTVAPLGYDLAKLFVTAAMRDGQLPPLARLVAAHDEAAGIALPREHLAWFFELHWVLTYPFAEKNGYRVPWPHLRASALAVLETLTS